MPVYVYETVHEQADVEPRRFEVRQSMLEPPLTHDPESGQPVRRVILGGLVIPRAPALARPVVARAASHGTCCPCCR